MRLGCLEGRDYTAAVRDETEGREGGASERARVDRSYEGNVRVGDVIGRVSEISSSASMPVLDS